MPTPDRTDPEVNELWDEFHAYVNVDSGQLRNWLLVRASDEDGFPGPPEQTMPQPGGAILGILGRRKVDLTNGDLDVMRTTVEQIQDLLADRPEEGAGNDQWRHALLDLGHDPLRAT
ncbi:DUF3140 domain-containing protein [Polymorphospora sp. NPDC050346]|uniref:DUF3140 domain-containing protein n=1 Tax=Polymorphospora sp. NPDC050346 TaxID=3155780 RepID=UPI0033E5C014